MRAARSRCGFRQPDNRAASLPGKFCSSSSVGVAVGTTVIPPPPSRPGEFHPEPLTEPCVTISRHTARAIHRGLPPSATTSRFLLLPVDQVDHDANGPPPSLRGHYSASSLLRDSPPLPCVSVLSASRGCRLCLFPFHRRTGSQVPYQSQD